MSKLKEFKNHMEHYYYDEAGRIQGEFKEWCEGELQEHSLFKDGKYHGEYKWWGVAGGVKAVHEFIRDDNNITAQVKELVNNINNITDEERMMIKLKFGIECLS